MDKDKEKQEISVLGRLFSLEALLIVMGLLSLISGFIVNDPTRILLGMMIIGGFLLFFLYRKRTSRK